MSRDEKGAVEFIQKLDGSRGRVFSREVADSCDMLTLGNMSARLAAFGIAILVIR